MKNLKISAGTITRAVLTLLAFINIVLEMFGYSVIPVNSEAVTTFISLLFLGVTTLASYWKNNSFTKNAKIADKILKGINTGEVPYKAATDLAKKVN